MSDAGGRIAAAALSLPLVGRVSEWSSVQAALRQAERGEGQVVVVEGEAGIGKSRLVQELADRVTGAGSRVLIGYAEEVTARRPFAAIAEAFALNSTSADPALARIGGMLASDPAESDGGSVEYRVCDALESLVERWCVDRPVTVIVEDVHWADPASLHLLGGLVRIAATLPLLVAVTHRPTPRSPDLEALLSAALRRGAHRLSLVPLPGDEVADLATAALGAPPGPHLREQLGRTGGNPLLTLELLGALDQDGSIRQAPDGSADVARSGTADVDAALAMTILHRLSFLPPAARELLRTASVLGSSFEVFDLCLFTGRPAIELWPALRAARMGGALAERGERLVFRHELIRDALYADIPRGTRASMHRQFGAALASAGGDASRIAEHLLRGVRSGDDESVELLRSTAEALRLSAPAVAAELIDRARSLIDRAHPMYGPLAADRAMALMSAGNAVDGERACREVLAQRLDVEREPVLRRMLLRSMIVGGRAAEALPVIERALAASATPDPKGVGLYSAASYLHTVAGDFDAALATADEAVRRARELGDPFSISEALHSKVQALGVHGEVAAAAELADDALAALRGVVAPVGAQTLTSTAGLMRMAAGRVQDGRDLLLHGRRVNEEIGAASGVALHHVCLGDGLYLTGEWDDATVEIEASAGLVGPQIALPASSAPLLAMMAVHRGDLDGARTHLAVVDAAVAAGAGCTRLYRRDLADALLAEAAGRSEQACETLVTLWHGLVASGNGFGVPEVGSEVVRRLVAVGRTGEAADVVGVVQRCARANASVAALTGDALVCEGLLHHDADLLMRAVQTHRRGHRPLNLALACEDAAGVLADDGHADRAGELLTEALGVHRSLGATRCAARVSARLRALGVRRVDTGEGQRPGRRRRAVPGAGWEALTATERRIVALVAQRLSNPEIAERTFLSRRTVETHVSHALAKTGLASRVELAAEALRRGIRPT